MTTNTAGIVYGTFAYSLWGLLPLYWNLMEAVPAVEILAHRIFWSFVVMSLVIIVTGGKAALTASMVDKKKLMLIFLCGFVVSLNWVTYIYAVNSGFVIEASMGYYINPLVVVLLGVTVFKEKLGRWQLTALIIAATGVIIITVQYGRIPWIALILALTFASYGMIKKIIRLDPVSGLVLETFIVMPFALFYLLSLEYAGTGALGSVAWPLKLVLAGTGIATATPLFLFARGIEKTTFSMMGFLQYIAPTINLILGIFVFKEYFSIMHLVSFCFIWAALIIFTLANLGFLKEPFRVKTGTVASRRKV
ncbi:MAG: EamA family transporter RarD [Bacillota bacterium]